MNLNKYGPYAPAANQLNVSLDVLQNNLPINKREGNIGQAKLEEAGIKSFKLALEKLKDAVQTKRQLRSEK